MSTSSTLTAHVALPASRLSHARRDHGRTARRPGFDLIYARTGSVFIPRDNGPEAIAMIREIGRSIDATDRHRHFPEGRLFRSDRLERASMRIARDNPERAQRLASIRQVLPPRPGGTIALMDAIDADVVVIAHTGLDQFESFTALARAVPLREPVKIVAWRVPRDQLPTAEGDRIAWLDSQWLRIDQHVARRKAEW